MLPVWEKNNTKSFHIYIYHLQENVVWFPLCASVTLGKEGVGGSRAPGKEPAQGWEADIDPGKDTDLSPGEPLLCPFVWVRYDDFQHLGPSLPALLKVPFPRCSIFITVRLN